MITLRKPIIYRPLTKNVKPIVPIRMPIKHKIMTPCRISPDVVDALNVSVYFIGKGIFLFTIFYCSMNWVYYRGMRKDSEKYTEQKKEEMKRKQEAKERLFPKKEKDNN